jgi:rod shape-determining protein MreD
MRGPARARLALLLGTILLAQLTLGSNLRIDGVHPDLMVLAAVAGGLVAGPDRGAIVGFLAGLGADLFVDTPFGLSALVFCVVGYGVGVARGGMVRSSRSVTGLTVLVASAGGEVLYALLGAIVGQDSNLTAHLGVIAGVVGVVDAAAAVVVVPAMAWALAGEAQRATARSRW